MDKNRLFKQLVLLLLALLLVSCRGSNPVPAPRPTAFTYATYAGGIWQIDVDGNRVQLLAPDGTRMRKENLVWSDDRRWLAYRGREFPEPGVSTETLFVLNREDGTVKKIEGPHRSIVYGWDGAHHIRVGVTDLLTPDRRQEWDWFLVDVESGDFAQLEVPKWSRPTPPPEPYLIESPDGKWAFLSREEGLLRTFYLVDVAGTQVATIYDQPASIDDRCTMWSEDSQWILYIPFHGNSPYDGNIFLFHPDDLSSIQLSHYHGERRIKDICCLKWSPDGEWLLFELEDSVRANQVCVIHFSSAPDLCCFDDIVVKSGQIVWGSDSRSVAFLATVAEENDIYILDVFSGEIRNLTNDGNLEIAEELIAY